MSPKFDHLSVCKTCKNRSFNLKKGLICKITNDRRDFIISENCPDYMADHNLIFEKSHKQKKLKREIATFLTVGIISTIIGSAATFIALYYGRVHFWIIGLLLIGISLLVHGVRMKKNLDLTRTKDNLDIIDDNLREY